MKRHLLLIFLLIWNISLSQTNKIIEIPTYWDTKNSNDTSLWYISTTELRRQIHLPDLLQSIDTFHFRLWTGMQAVDIWTTDRLLYYGMITNYAQQYDPKLLRKGIYKIGKIYSNQITLDSSKARQLFNIVDRLSIVAIPSDDKIKDWRQGLDGIEFLIEISTPNQYDFKTYWTPGVFADTLPEAKQIQALVNYLYKDFKIYKYYQKLRPPGGSYLRNGIPGIEIRIFNQPVSGATAITDLL
jgi:hypothetical protein